MPQNSNADNAGEDTGADEGLKGGNGGNGNADDKDKPGNKSVTGGDADKDDEKSGAITFKSQKELDDMIARRVSRATKKAEDDAKLSKEQLLEKERDEAKREVLERDLRDDFVEQTGLPIGPGRRLFKMYRDDLDIDDKGKAGNMADVVKQAKKDFPEAFKAVADDTSKRKPKGDGGEGSDGKVGGDMNSALRKMAGFN